MGLEVIAFRFLISRKKRPNTLKKKNLWTNDEKKKNGFISSSIFYDVLAFELNDTVFSILHLDVDDVTAMTIATSFL